jgi:hypothetical protein
MDATSRGLDQVGDGLPWDWEPDGHEGTCGQDQDFFEFVEGSSLVLFWTSSHEEVGGRRLRCSWLLLIELVLRDVGLEYIPKLALWVHKHHFRKPSGLYMDLNKSYQQFVVRLNDLIRYLLYFPEENPKQLDQDEKNNLNFRSSQG